MIWIWTTQLESNLHCVAASLFMEFDWANILEVKLKCWPVETDDLMNQTGLTGELLGVCRKQGVGAAPSDRGGISGRWLHEWSAVVTAVDRWQRSFSRHVLSSLGQLQHTLVLYSCRFWALRIIRNKSKQKQQQNIGLWRKQNQSDFKLKGTQTSSSAAMNIQKNHLKFFKEYSLDHTLPAKGTSPNYESSC